MSTQTSLDTQTQTQTQATASLTSKEAPDMAASKAPLTAAKQQLRRMMKQKLSAMPHEAVLSQSRQIFETLKAFKPYQDAKRISIYLAMPSGEVQTDAIVRHALASGKQVFIPYLHKAAVPVPDTPRRVMDMVRLKNLEDYESLGRDSWGIPSIDEEAAMSRQRILDDPSTAQDPEAEAHTLDLMLMPGVAFDVDPAGLIRRLGHGKGFYDYFINRYIARQQLVQGEDDPILLYGLALSEQLLPGSNPEQIPIGPFDRTLHGLVVGSGDVKESVSRIPSS